MRTHRLFSKRVLATAACSAMVVAVVAGCGGDASSAPQDKSGVFFGPSQNLGAGTAKTYTVLDRDGHPTEVGLRLSASALDGLPTTNPDPPLMLMLDFPDQADSTAFDHVMLNWNPQGHDPAPLFGKPHFDFHFDMVDMATIQSINPADPNYATKADHAPEAKYVPQDFVLPPGPPRAAQAVPAMGVHLVDASDTSLVPGSYDFKEIIINGTWDGRYTFIEPMITRDWLLTNPSLEQQLKLPQAYQKNGYFPTTYRVHVDEQSKDYLISLAGLSMRQAT